jgi:CRISPR-associated protein Cas1
MTELGNILYVTTPNAALHLDHDTVRVAVDSETTLRVPLLRLSGIVCFGAISISPWLMQRCAEDGRSLVLLDRTGVFRARLEGPTKGNVLLRRAQHLALSDPERPARIGRQIAAGKLQNSRQVLLRAARETGEPSDARVLLRAAEFVTGGLVRLHAAEDLNTVRGIEGDAARAYFGAFGAMVRVDRASFAPSGRTRRPPRDRMNALLSFLYALLRSECVSALEGVGLDPQVGYLHALRPGRPALALDLMEEVRSVLADRLALVLVNRRQVRREGFRELPGGAVYLDDDTRRTVIGAWQKRKQEAVEHRVLREKVPLGLVPHIQARLLARHLRGDLEHYLPFLYR